MTKPPDLIIQLVQHFHKSIDLYRSGALNETETRIQFINPFFEALGWDMSNREQVPDLYKDVVHEHRLTIQDSRKAKAPDYSFRIGGVRKFFVEAKKPSVNVGTNINAAFQLRRYGWSAKLSVSILTDFEEFAVYDCRIMPNKNDSASQARVKYFRYVDYEKKWDEIYGLFSKESVLQGSLEHFTEKKIKTGITVDKAFLSEIETWRENLATNIAWRNPQIKQRELNFAVQMTINRMIFLRICEDRGIESYGQLLDLLKGDNLYQELGRLFLNADYRYNSGLFHFQSEKGREEQDNFTLSLKIEDQPLIAIIRKLYPPESPYEFSVIPVEILGQVYEQFLGKVIRLSSRQAVVEDKPEVRKAGGVYYTPSYIVDYIVKHTIGRYLEGKKPEDIKDLSVLDPSCGSGSFLIVAYQFLLDWYLTEYLKNQKKYKKLIYQTMGGEYRLTSQEKKRILLAHVYGVDIDQQAVETSKLSLLLKVLEGESQETVTRQLTLFKERALPDLDNNIKCGNSLIASDYYENVQLNLLSEDEIYRVNVFDWESSFPPIIKRGGFDVIIGNPPYIRIQALKEWASLDMEYYKQKYKSASKGNYDIYVIFVEKGLNLLKDQGHLGFILPHKFFNAPYGKALRDLINQDKYLEKIVYFGDLQIFEKPTTYTCLLFLNKSCQEYFEMNKVTNLQDWQLNQNKQDHWIINSLTRYDNWNFEKNKNPILFQKLNQHPFVSLGSITDNIFQGIRTSANPVYVVDLISQVNNILTVYSKALDRIVTIESNLTHPFLQGKEIKPYQILYSNKLIIIPYQVINNKVQLINERKISIDYPELFNYFLENKRVLENREKGKMTGEKWYSYVYPKNIELMGKPKILVPDIANSSSFVLDEQGIYTFTSGYGIILKSNICESNKYILGLLNSKLLDFYLKKISTPIRGGFFRYFTQFLEQLPIRLIDFSNDKDKNKHDLMVQLVEQMLRLHQQFNQENVPSSKKIIQQQIKVIDKQINQLVYELYDLTDEIIAIIEGY
jgi:type I restriction-modification system DNA methylase subunit